MAETTQDEDERNLSALHYYNIAVVALDLLYDAAASGHPGAEEELAHLSDTLADKADRWRKMKYLKK